MSRLDTLIFDVDGTLADTEEVHRQAFNAAFTDFNLDWHWSKNDYKELLAISGGRERMRDFAEHLGKDFKRPADLDSYIARLHRLKTRHYQRMLVDGHIKLRPGARRLIDECRNAGVRLAIATSSTYANLRTLLDNNLPAGWDSWFQVIATCDVVETKKPSPAVYQFVLEELEVSPQACIALEDTQNGNQAALAAGINTVITTHPLTQDRDFAGASLVVDSLGEPDLPAGVSAGTLDGTTHVTLDLLRKLLEHANPTAQAPTPSKHAQYHYFNRTSMI